MLSGMLFPKMIQFLHLAENINKKNLSAKSNHKKVSSEGELNPGLPRERPETKPLCHRGIHINVFVTNVIQYMSRPE